MTGALRTIPRGIWILMLVALGLRVAWMLATVDLGADNYHEFGEIARNLRAGHGYSLFHLEGAGLSPWHSDVATPFPSAFMPPGYVWYLYPFLEIGDAASRNLLLLLIQHLAGAGLVPLVFALTQKVYSLRAAWSAAALAAVLPELVVSTSTYGATVFVHMLVLGIFLLLARGASVRTWRNAILLGCLLGLLVLFRFEALAFGLIVLVLVWRAAGASATWKVALVFALLLSPWVIRNAFVFDKPILSTSTGLNLFRGNNAVGIGVWSDPELDAELPLLAGPSFEMGMNELYLESALRHAASDPVGTLLRSAEKVWRLWSFDPDDHRSSYWVRVALWAMFVLLAGFGCLGVRPPAYLVAYVGFATLMAAVFFALARHQVLMEIALIPLAGHGLAQFCTLARHRWRRLRASRP